jgi:hypothetical protein
MNDDQDYAFGDDDGMDDTASVICPSCGEEIELVLDPGGGPVQEYVEDCEVCCHPMQLTVTWDDDGVAHAHAVSDDDGA